MEEIEQACGSARAIRQALDEAIELGRGLPRAMASLDSEPLLRSAARRDEIHASLERMTRELAGALRELQRKRGWQEVTLPRLFALAPQAATHLEAELTAIRVRASELRAIDAGVRASGARALSWLRSLRPDASAASAYDRRGQMIADNPLRTASRTL